MAAPLGASPPTASLRPVLRDPDQRRIRVTDAERLIAKAKLRGDVGFAVADAKTGLGLESGNPRLGLPPASVAKALTALYALDCLGETHRFETQVLATGGIVNGEVQGDLVLVGGGDPTLDTKGLARLAASLKEAGVSSVKGAFKVYDGHLHSQRQIDPGQPDHVGYNPAIAGIALNYNRVHFEWKRGGNGYAITMDGRSGKYRPEVEMAAMKVANRRGPVYTYSDDGARDNWTVAKGALGKGGARWLPVRKPGLYAGDVFATLAGSHGIRLRKPEVIDTLPQGEIAARHQSGELRGILKDMLKWSTNLTAEMVGLAATRVRIGKVRALVESAAEMNRWAIAELGMMAPKLVDHSGLGEASEISAQDMVTGLVKANDADLRPILKQFVLRDSERRPKPNHPIRVDAKTGTLNFVSGLAGYMTARDGTELAFAIFSADEATGATISRAQRERPPGARSWNGRAKRLQQALIERWDALYGNVSKS